MSDPINRSSELSALPDPGSSPGPGSIEGKIEEACRLYADYGRELLADPKVAGFISRLEEHTRNSLHTMIRLGVVELCRWCEVEEGGSCCGAGIENRYDRILLLMNLLLGVSLPVENRVADSCHFLTPRGCALKARHVLCVNYLCRKIHSALSPSELMELQAASGEELETAFRFQEAIKRAVARCRAGGPPWPVERLRRTVAAVAGYYDDCRVGYQGTLGFRKSTDLAKFIPAVEHMLQLGLIDLERMVFVDLGCADGRVNLVMSYFVKRSIGIEIDHEFLAEYEPRKRSLAARLERQDLIPPPDNISLFLGDSLDPSTFAAVSSETGVGFADVDLFYTYITLHDLFAGKIAADAKPGALYCVYGFNRVLPHYDGLEVVVPDLGSQGIAALYRKPG